MKKAYRYSCIIVFLACIFMNSTSVSSYQFINENNRYGVNRLKNQIHEITEEYYSTYKKRDGNSSIIGTLSGSLCPNGITLIGSNGERVVHDFEEYVAGVVAAENSWHEGDNIENIKAQAIAARTYAVSRTNYCQKPIRNGQTDQVYRQTSDPYILRGVQETANMVVLQNGKIISTEYDAFCVKSRSGDNYILRQQSQVIPKSFVQEMGSYYVGIDYCFGHGHGMSQIGARYLQRLGWTFNQILTYYYPAGIEIVRAGSSVDWKQYDSAWKNVKIGGSTLGAVGCYVTSIATLIAKSGASTKLGYNFNPGTFAEYLSSQGAFASDGSLITLNPIKNLVNIFDVRVDSDTSSSNIKNQLGQGKYVQIWLKKANGGSHFVAVDHIEGDRIFINDPGSTCTVLNDCYPGSTKRNIRVYTIG